MISENHLRVVSFVVLKLQSSWNVQSKDCILKFFRKVVYVYTFRVIFFTLFWIIGSIFEFNFVF